MKCYLALLVTCSAAATYGQATPAAGTMITNVSVIDVRGGPTRPHLTVLVSGDRIVQVGRDVTPHAGTSRVVDGTGKFLIPGLWDMHVHLFFDEPGLSALDVTLPLLLANGVTGVRDMGSELEPILRTRREVASGARRGPRLVVAGPMLDGPTARFPASMTITSPDDGRRAVARLASAGVDFIKIQSGVPHDAYLAIADECRQRKIPFVGHVPDAVRATEAVRAGQGSFEHLIGIFEGSSTAEEAFLHGGKSPGAFLKAYDPAREAALVQLLAAQQVWQVPTLYWERGQWLVDTVNVTRDPDLRYVPAAWRTTTWPKWTASILKDLDTDPLAVRDAFVAHELRIIARLHRAGVPMLAGTDTPAGVGVIPGASLHHELERFVAAGLTPMEALQTATLNPARFLGRLNEMGTVEAGKVADLVLLDADPTVDIRNTRRIAGVVAAGRYLSRRDLDGMLNGVAAVAGRR
jgi:imidazolonepropionase-like amidohydrolase